MDLNLSLALDSRMVQLASLLNLQPFYSDALFVLDGTILNDSGTYYFVDKKNAKNFLITGYDFTAGLTKGFPYKSAATISAPAADATLIAADINNFLYDSGGTPNQIPVVSLFQDIDYGHKLFCRHIAQVVDENGVETAEPYICDIVLYDTVKATTELTACQTYYGVPTEDATAYWVDAVNGSDTSPGDGSKAHPWKTLVKAVSTVTTGNVIYCKSGNVLPTSYLNDSRNHDVKGIGFVNVTPKGTDNGLKISSTSEIFSGIISRPQLVVTRDLYPAAAVNTVISNIYLVGIGGGLMPAGAFAEFKNNVIKGVFNNGIVFNSTPVNVSMDSNYINIQPTGGYLFVILASGTGNIKNNKIITTGAICSIATSGIINLTGNYIEGTFAYIRNDGQVNILYNIFKADLQITWNNNTNISVISNNTFTDKYVNCLSAALISNNLITQGTSAQSFSGFQLSAANEIQSAIIRNNTMVTAGTSGGGWIIGSDSSLSSDNKVALSLFEKNKFISTGVVHGCLFGYQQNPIGRYNWIEFTQNYGFVVEDKDAATDYVSGGIYGNVIKSGGYAIVCNMDGLIVYNNTFIMTGEIGVSTYAGQSHTQIPINAKIKNNIFISLGTSADTRVVKFESVTQEVDYNIYYSPNAILKFQIGANSYTFAEWQALGFDTHSVVLTAGQFAALFTDYANSDYSLPAGSAAIGAGVDLGTDYDDLLDASTDWGDTNDLAVVVTKQQGENWDVGAYVH